MSISTKEPIQLIQCYRFDLMAKLIYAKHRHIVTTTKWYSELYNAHIMVFNGGWEHPGTKKTKIEHFEPEFNKLLDSVSKINKNTTAVPIGSNNILVNGAHRIISCYVNNIPVNIFIVQNPGTVYNYLFFRNYKIHVKTGLLPKYTDPMALEYAKNKKNTHLIFLFPSIQEYHNDILSMLFKITNVVYDKTLRVSSNELKRYMTEFYKDEKWIGNKDNSYKGAVAKYNLVTQNTLSDKMFIKVIMIDTDLSSCNKIKTMIRSKFKQFSKNSVHINDTYNETLRLSQLFFNRNSLHFMRKSIWNSHHYNAMKKMENFPKNNDSICIDSSTIMELYGIRKANDVDYLHYSSDIPRMSNSFHSHNKHTDMYYKTGGISINDIIYDPNYHFYYNGVKFGTLETVKILKKNRNEIPKDINDLMLLESFLTEN